MDESELHLDLAPSEATVLDEGIDQMLREGRFELAHTDDHDYREGLRARLSVLEHIHGKLASLLRAKAATSA